MNPPSIAIVNTFFGPVPVWFPAFLLSCRRNPDVRWFIYADFEVTFTVPENVTVRRIDLDELNRRASDALAVRVRIDPASLRKICDLKPVYGLMFADDLRGFDWWGCSDLDIVWGGIRRFVTGDVLQKHDVISSRRHKLSGHFTLFRNNGAINRLFEIVPNATALLATTAHQSFDERVLTEHLRHQIARGPDACPRVFWPEELTINSTYQRSLPEDDVLLWRDGRTFDLTGREFMYLHFHKLKQSMGAIDFGYDDAPDSFVIGRRGVFAQPAPHAVSG